MILLFAILINLFLGELVDSLLILIIVIMVAVIGFLQEYRAEKAIEMLKKMATPSSLVIRSGKPRKIPTKELVSGDLIIIEEVSKIPADARLLYIISILLH